MKRKSIALVVTFLMVLGVGLPSNVVHANDSDEVYVALGDSLAFGIGATDPATTGYVPLFFEFLEDEGDVEVLTNLSVPAETSGSMISGGQLAAAVATIADPDNDVEVVTLDIGGNDLLGLLGRTGGGYRTYAPPVRPHRLIASLNTRMMGGDRQ